MYPYILLNKKINIYPIFWDKYDKLNYVFMNDDSIFMKNLTDEEIKDQKKFNEKISSFRSKSNSTILYSWYLEKRLRLFSVLGFNQMISEKRYYHLWIDLSVLVWTQVFCPLDWEVFEFWYEEWEWNYWWYIILKHNFDWIKFYSLYWHLSYESIKLKYWDKIKAWNKMWIIWNYNENWWYFHHLHLQIITEKWKENWFFSKWYCTKEQLKTIENYTPNPLYIFRF